MDLRSVVKVAILIIGSLVFTNQLRSQKLSKYTCHVDRVDIEGVENEKKRTFDKDGIIMLKKKYHPLNIVQYGILAHYNFITTGDSIYYNKCVDQIKYFKDTTRYTYMFDGKGIGLPYHFDFWDLKKPWYSGMTQGYAISYLLRYYELTGDDSIFPLIKKITYVLLQPQSEGGTISVTKEGCTWIEEYPNSKKSPQVINGFVNGFIGLHEYCLYFPEDTLAIRIRDETYEAVKYSLDLYDNATWTTYNRNNRKLSNGYLRYQVYEMKHLYEIFNEPFFDYQMRIWSVMALNKPVEDKSKAFKFRNHTMSTPANKVGSVYFPSMPKKSVLNLNEIKISSFSSLKERKAKLKHKELSKSSKTPKKKLLCFETKEIQNVDFMELTFNDTLQNLKVELFKVSKTNRLSVSKEKIEYSISLNKLIIYFPLSDVNNLIVRLKSKTGIDFELKNTKYYNSSLVKSPFFTHIKTKPIPLEQGVSYKVDYLLENSKNVVIFYKYGLNNKSLTKEKWSAYKTVGDKFFPSKTGVYQFMIVYDWESPFSTMTEFNLVPLVK